MESLLERVSMSVTKVLSEFKDDSNLLELWNDNWNHRVRDLRVSKVWKNPLSIFLARLGQNFLWSGNSVFVNRKCHHKVHTLQVWQWQSPNRLFSQFSHENLIQKLSYHCLYPLIKNILGITCTRIQKVGDLHSILRYTSKFRKRKDIEEIERSVE